uniref:DUF19 domain-containing protein n=1 Tax=Caenorhabditis tropicalis TaxID=1561998 RepID=A0A1I7U6X7_9PELO
MEIRSRKRGKEEIEGYKHPCSAHNFFFKVLNGIEEDDCSENCFNSIRTESRILENLQTHQGKIKIFLRKSNELETEFFNRLVLQSEDSLVKDCIAKQFENKTCLEWFQFCLEHSEQPDEAGLERSPKFQTSQTFFKKSFLNFLNVNFKSNCVNTL